MSYCGACGSFFYPDCPRRREGLCIPSLNPFEQQIVEAQAAVVAANAEIHATVLRADGLTSLAEKVEMIAATLSRLFEEPGAP
jgi:hypothetical protein